MTRAAAWTRGEAFGQVCSWPCPVCGGVLRYLYGNWYCGENGAGCPWTTARDVTRFNGGGWVTLEQCPKCGNAVLYNGNYFCEYWGDTCDWAMAEHPRGKSRELALRLFGRTS